MALRIVAWRLVVTVGARGKARRSGDVLRACVVEGDVHGQLRCASDDRWNVRASAGARRGDGQSLGQRPQRGRDVPCAAQAVTAEPRTVVVTGASTGIGLAIARVLAGRGVHVFGSVRREVDADRLRADLGPLFTPLLFDVTDV